MLRMLAALALLTVACATEAPTGVQPEPLTAAAGAALETAPPPPCEVVFTPTAVPAFVAEVSHHARRWAQATGCDIRVGGGGIRVELARADDPRLFNPTTGTFAGGATVLLDSGITVVVPETHRAEAVPHELGHALARSARHGRDEGLMNGVQVADCITASDLEYVCAALDCGVFAAERCD